MRPEHYDGNDVAMANATTSTGPALSFTELCRACGKPQLYVRNLQKNMGLPVQDNSRKHSASYLRFIRKVVSLRAFGVPTEDILDLFEREKSLLRLLKMDAFSDSPTWFLDNCDGNGNTDCRLMLTGYDVGFPLERGLIQANLDFGRREQELFDSREMGEDAQRSLAAYLRMRERIKARVIQEKPVLEEALRWADALGGGKLARPDAARPGH